MDAFVILIGSACIAGLFAGTVGLVLLQDEDLGPLEPAYPLTGTTLDDQHDWGAE